MIVRAARRAAREATYLGFRLACRSLPSPPFDPSAVRKILVPLYAGIGNIVLYTPALRAIRERFADAEIVAAVGNSRRNEEVLGPEIVDRVVEIPLGAPLGESSAAVRRVRNERFDLCVNAFHCVYPLQVAFTAYARIPWRCGHVSSPGWHNPYDFLYNIPAHMQRDQHEIDRYLELAFALGVERETVDPRPFFRVTADARTRASALLSEQGLEGTRVLVAVHAGTSRIMRWKQWGLDRFEAVVRELAAESAVAFVLVGAPDERAEQGGMIEHLRAALPGRVADLVGRTTIAELAALIERATVLVGNDSGPMQIAAALDVPTVVPWGPSDLPRNRPRGPEHTVLFAGLPCSPCYRMPGDSKVHLCHDRLCLSSITVEEVVAAARERLRVADSVATTHKT